MFETSQQEKDSGSGKVVAGVIAVVVVLLVAVYFLFLRGQEGTATGGAKPAAGASASAASTAADPMKDLRITRSTLHRDQTQTMAMWDIQVENRSKGVAYKDIKYATNYYNAQDAVIYHNEGTLGDAVDPNDQHTYSNVNDGLYPVGTVRYTIELKGASPAQ